VLITVGGGGDRKGVCTEGVIALQDRLAEGICEWREIAAEEIDHAGGVEIDAANQLEVGIGLPTEDDRFGSRDSDFGRDRPESRDEDRECVRILGMREKLECPEKRFFHGAARFKVTHLVGKRLPESGIARGRKISISRSKKTLTFLRSAV